MADSTAPDFWNERYQCEKTPWDFHGVPAALTQFLDAAKPGRVLLPGCGSGYEIAAFLDAGWEAWGLDFSQAAVRRARALLGTRADRVLFGDFFNYEFGQPFDLIYERTFLCALPPALWESYASRIKNLLIPGGRLAGFFFYGPEAAESPPYPLSRADAERLFPPGLELIEDQPAADSLPLFAGKERWQQWKKRSAGPPAPPSAERCPAGIVPPPSAQGPRI
ncbi:MAG TPA: methyltransferase [Chthoniobacterales bacterium]